MARDDRGPSHEPGRTAHRGDPAAARTPPTRPDERGTGKERADRIASTKEERTTHPEDRPQGTAAEAPEEIARDGGAGGGDRRPPGEFAREQAAVTGAGWTLRPRRRRGATS